ncbi:hypothetical protein BBJ28_00001090 [Nothophytophthora sp. Chile5]|nr:hypothetical protein BBJ28_00001090 [Nothophytophthora sp. Chile5]
MAVAATAAPAYAPPHVLKGVLKRKLMLEEDAAARTKKQRVAAVTVVAMDVMNRLLAPSGDIGYDVTDDEWEHLVQLTQQHQDFDKFFTFPENAPGWVSTASKKKKSHLKVVAVDCEMCVTASYETNERMSSALCRVSAVDGEDMLRSILSDFIVHQPEKGFRMVAPKTDIHGITPQQIAQSKISVERAQKRMLKYIDSDTIVVGHSVHGDLASMRINHRRVIDTALIFRRKEGDPTRATPGLKCLTKFLLGFEMPDGHDSTVDAQASMLAAKYAARNVTGSIIPSPLELHGPRGPHDQHRQHLEKMRVKTKYTGPPQLIPTAFQLGQAAVAPMNEASFLNMATIMTETAAPSPNPTDDQTDAAPAAMSEAAIARSCRLRVHRIPKGVTSRDIENFFVQNAKVVPSAVEPIAWLPAQNRGSCNVTFPTNAHAALAFESAQGPNGKNKLTKDSVGRAQKTIAVVNTKGKTFKNVTLGVV